MICHPLMTCGLCRACRAGDDMHCENGEFPGISRDGGFADLLKTNARAVVKLDPVLEPKDIAALADAGLTAYHAVRKSVPHLYAGTKAVVMGAGGLGHIGIQCLKALTPTEIIVTDPNEKALELAREWGADETVKVEERLRGHGARDDGRQGRRGRLRLRRRARGRRRGLADDDGRAARTTSSGTAARSRSRP